MPSRMSFDLGFGRPAGEPRDPQAPFCVLVLADLSGAGRPPLRERRALRVDVDNLEQVAGRIASTLTLSPANGGSTLVVRSLEDFHPDRLIGSVPAFSRLKGLRDELHDPDRFERAAAALGGPAAAPLPAAPGASADADAAADLERLLGRKPRSPASASAASSTGALDAWLRELVAPHVRPEDGGRRDALVRSVDAALAEAMRAVLHDPALQRLEACWRGIARWVGELGGDEAVELWLLDVGADELAADVREWASELPRSAIAAPFGGADGTPRRPWALVVVDHAFGAGVDDAIVLAALGSLAARAGAALVADADAALVAAGGLDELGEPARWTPPAVEQRERWQALRALDCAPSIGLVLPRVLMRQPYGERSDPIASFSLQEVVDASDRSSYLWGSGALALALLAGVAFREDGGSMQLDRCRELADLPTYSYRDGDDEVQMRPCAEVPLGERAAERILSDGLMPLLARRDRPSVQLLRWQSIADPPQALRGPWSG